MREAGGAGWRSSLRAGLDILGRMKCPSQGHIDVYGASYLYEAFLIHLVTPRTLDGFILSLSTTMVAKSSPPYMKV